MTTPEEIEAIIEDLKDRYPELVTGQEAINEFENLTIHAEEFAEIDENVNTTWSADRVDEIADSLDEERVAEIAAGDELTEEEQKLWENRCIDRQMCSDYITVYCLKGNISTVWFLLIMDGQHQGSTYFDGAGPFWDIPSLTEYCVDRFKDYYGVWTSQIDED